MYFVLGTWMTHVILNPRRLNLQQGVLQDILPHKSLLSHNWTSAASKISRPALYFTYLAVPTMITGCESHVQASIGGAIRRKGNGDQRTCWLEGACRRSLGL